MSLSSYFLKRRLREDGSAAWDMLKKRVNVAITDASISVRGEEGLVADIPRASIESFALVPGNALRMTPIGSTLAPEMGFRLDNDKSVQEFGRLLEKFDYPLIQKIKSSMTDTSTSQQSTYALTKRHRLFSGLPDLSDPAVIEIITQLLFDDEFIKFTVELENLIASTYLPKMNTSDILSRAPTSAQTVDTGTVTIETETEDMDTTTNGDDNEHDDWVFGQSEWI